MTSVPSGCGGIAARPTRGFRHFSPAALLARFDRCGVSHFPLRLESADRVIVYAPMGSGLLTGTMTHERIAGMPVHDWRKSNSNFQEPLLSRTLLRAVGKQLKARPDGGRDCRDRRSPRAGRGLKPDSGYLGTGARTRAGRHSAKQWTQAFRHGGVREDSITQHGIRQPPHQRSAPPQGPRQRAVPSP
jgi:hypothetical protein